MNNATRGYYGIYGFRRPNDGRNGENWNMEDGRIDNVTLIVKMITALSIETAIRTKFSFLFFFEIMSIKVVGKG